MVLVRKLCKIWTFGDESSKPVFEQKPVFFRRFSWKTEPAQSVRDLTFGTEGWGFESLRVYSRVSLPYYAWERGFFIGCALLYTTLRTTSTDYQNQTAFAARLYFIHTFAYSGFGLYSGR